MPWSHWHVGPSSELVSRTWGIRSWPTYVVVDSNGEIVSRTGDLRRTKAVVERATQRSESLAGTLVAPLCTGETAQEPCWRAVEGRPGCHVWNPDPSRDTSFAFEGSADCANGQLSGTGTATWRWQEDGEWRWWKADGTFEDGKAQGHWVGLYNSGTQAQGSYLDSKASGQWVFNFANGTQSEGPLADGVQHGQWIETYSSGVRGEGLFEKGKRHGPWVYTHPNGSRRVNEWRHGEMTVESVPTSQMR